jgi:hypothetical protein
MDANRFVLSCLSVLGLLLIGCGDTDESAQLGEWTMKEEPFQLTEDLRVSETEDFYFGSITALDVTSEGRIVVADRQANDIKILHPDGTLLDTLGGPGEGPGEFQTLTRARLGPRDSLYALDLQRAQITVYAPDSPYERHRTITIPRDEGFMATLFVASEGLAGSFGSGTSPEDGVIRPAPSAIRTIDDTGTPGDTLFHNRSNKIAFAFGENGEFSAESIPFSRETLIASGPNGRLYSGWTDSLHIEAHTLTGDSNVIASLPTDPVPVTEVARDSALSNIDDELQSMTASALPDTKPAFTQMLVADDGRIWIRRPTEGSKAETVPWWILDPTEKTIRKAPLPPEVELRVVHNRQVYGTTTTDTGAPAIVRYQINTTG